MLVLLLLLLLLYSLMTLHLPSNFAPHAVERRVLLLPSYDLDFGDGAGGRNRNSNANPWVFKYPPEFALKHLEEWIEKGNKDQDEEGGGGDVAVARLKVSEKKKCY